MTDVALPESDRRTSSVHELVDARDIVRSLFDQSGLCVATLDCALRITDANADFLRLFGSDKAKIGGLQLGALLHPSVRGTMVDQLRRLVDGQRNRFSDKVIGLRPGSCTFGAELVGIAVSGEVGRVQQVMVILRPEKTDHKGHMISSGKKILTDIDARILEGVAAGVSTVQLASMLYLSRGGVEYHVTNLLRKLKAKNRPSLVSRAYSMGLFGVGAWPPRVLPDYVK
ncbi:helix-turn-helix transcriptional regulator [Amycolatopsis suaedae]|uniref:Helix-turn-helix transcriptional regulator n=1 Tax=Amycolatopsis suaedae TaxID=2510978 RepID=A0A4Q7J073_9PSEU|nr:PAS and helix-turn-helix domain-containing protein [Amycolatopsis suaedae]RZQ60189.1 helix-turn-helix transcriptional regulator [Amycolatopsis suaedae]